MNAMALNAAKTARCRLWANAKPSGMRRRPIAMQKAGKDWRAGSTANYMIAAHRTTTGMQNEQDSELRDDRSPLGESSRMTIAVKEMADAPSGHAVAIQKISTAPKATKARPALTKAGSQSGTTSRSRRW